MHIFQIAALFIFLYFRACDFLHIILLEPEPECDTSQGDSEKHFISCYLVSLNVAI